LVEKRETSIVLNEATTMVVRQNEDRRYKAHSGNLLGLRLTARYYGTLKQLEHRRDWDVLVV